MILKGDIGLVRKALMKCGLNYTSTAYNDKRAYRASRIKVTGAKELSANIHAKVLRKLNKYFGDRFQSFDVVFSKQYYGSAMRVYKVVVKKRVPMQPRKALV